MTCTPCGVCTSGTLSISSLGPCLSPGATSGVLCPPFLALQDCPAFLILCLQSLHLGPELCCWSDAKPAALIYFPMMMSRFFASHLFLMQPFLPSFFWIKCFLPTLLDETFPPFLFESWPILTLPSENGLCTEKIPVAL